MLFYLFNFLNLSFAAFMQYNLMVLDSSPALPLTVPCTVKCTLLYIIRPIESNLDPQMSFGVDPLTGSCLTYQESHP